jgi:SH3-like domain-containing protein
MRALFLALLVLLLLPDLAGPVRAAGDDVLRYVSLDTDKAFLRTGPGTRYPVEWVYVRRGWPFEVISEYGYWRKVRDIDGTSGWIHQNLLTAKRHVIVTGSMESAYAEPKADAGQVMLLEKGVVADLVSCEGDWCDIAAKGHEGWIRRNFLWGADDIPAK